MRALVILNFAEPRFCHWLQHHAFRANTCKHLPCSTARWVLIFRPRQGADTISKLVKALSREQLLRKSLSRDLMFSLWFRIAITTRALLRCAEILTEMKTFIHHNPEGAKQLLSEQALMLLVDVLSIYLHCVCG